MPYADPEAQRAYQREWVAHQRAEWLEDKSCVRCGSTESLEIDHVDSSTKVDHKVWSWSKERREAELVKCQALCHGCHVDKTAEERLRPHGTPGRYEAGCKCTPCREANTARCAVYKATKKVAVAAGH